MQSAKDLAQYIGRLGNLTTKEGFTIPVIVQDGRYIYGSVQFDVEGSSGNGCHGRMWVEARRVSFPGQTVAAMNEERNR